MSTAVASPEVSNTFAPDDIGRWEFVDGKWRDKHVGVLEILLANLLAQRMAPFLATGKPGAVLVEAGFRLRRDGSLQRKPDVAVVSHERWTEIAATAGDFWDAVPDLAVEIVSPSNRASEIDEKVRDYFEAGVSSVWVVYPTKKPRFYVYTSPVNVRIFAGDDEITDVPGLPGFRLKVSEAFAGMGRD